MAKLYYLQPGEQKPNRKSPPLPPVNRYRQAFYITLGLLIICLGIIVIG